MENAAAISSAPSLQAVAEDIAAGVGTILEVSPTGNAAPVFVFQENHAFRLQQAEVAVMLNRLYSKHGLRRIGLEGACVERFAQASWLEGEYDPSSHIGPREDVIVQLLVNGEISSVEMMGLVYGDVRIEPVETTELYDFDRSSLKEDAQDLVNYLYAIAQLELSDADYAEYRGLLQQGKKDLALSFALEHTEHHDLLSTAISPTDMASRSVSDWLDLLGRIRDVAGPYAQRLEPWAAGFSDFVAYEEAADKRGKKMAERMAGLAGETPSAPIALSCGAAHDEIPPELKARGVPYVVIRPESYAWQEDPTRLSDEEYARKERAQSTGGASSLGELLCGHWKYPPVIGEVWAQSLAEVCLVTDCIAEAVAVGGVPPFSDRVLEGLPKLQHVTVLSDTVAEDHGEAVFSVMAERGDGTSVQLWIRARCDQVVVERVLEQRLLDAIEEMKLGGSDSSQRNLFVASSQTIAAVGLDLNSVSQPIRI